MRLYEYEGEQIDPRSVCEELGTHLHTCEEIAALKAKLDVATREWGVVADERDSLKVKLAEARAQITDLLPENDALRFENNNLRQAVADEGKARAALLTRAQDAEAKLAEVERLHAEARCLVVLESDARQQAEAERDNWKACVADEVGENLRLFEALGIVAEMETDEECSSAVLSRAVLKLKQRAEQAEARLAAWEAAESLPDCPACAALDAAQEKP